MSNFRTQFNSHVEFREGFPKISQLKKSKHLKGCESFLLIFDQILLKNDSFKKWATLFPWQYQVEGGEQLKDLDNFPQHTRAIAQIVDHAATQSLCIISVGGGSVGDFSGFLASVYKRGVRLVHVPTTWLAALDSAHGGKTALNLGGVKNQIGSFFPASEVVIIKEMLESLPSDQMISGYGELIKMSLLAGGKLYRANLLAKECSFENIWSFLPLAISEKYKVVKKDPYEEKGDRQILNLGHTFGHVLESYYKIPHGLAVGLGIRFSLNWSRKRNYLTKLKFSQMISLLGSFQMIRSKDATSFRKNRLQIDRQRLEEIVSKDKKRTGSNGVTFIFMMSAGKPIRKTVTIKQIITEAVRQGWVL